MSVRRTARLRLRLVALAGAMVMLSGCYGYHLDRRETISASAGDAQAANRIIQMRDPWPPGAWDKTIDHDGIRMRRAIETYHDPDRGLDSLDREVTGIAIGPTVQ